MATENRTPDDLQEAVAATLRRLRGEVGKPGVTPAPARVEPQFSAAAPEEPAPLVAPAVNRDAAEPDLLSRSEPEIPPTPASTLADGGAEQYRLDPPRGRSRLLPYALSFVAIVVFAGIVWWAYRAIVSAPNTGPVPTIAADSTPAKVPPAVQQSTDTTGQQQTVYDQISGGTTQPKSETLLPTPEAPQTPPSPPTPVPSTTDAGTTTGPTADSGSATQTLVPPPAPLATATTGSTAAPATTSDTSAAGASTGGTTSTDTSSGTATSSGTTTTADAGSTATQPATGTDAGSTAGTGAAADTVTTNPSTDDAELYGVPILAPTTTTAPAASTTTNVASADTSGATQSSTVADNFHIQLAALKSEAEANKTWKRILAKHNDVLGSLTVHIVRADLGAQGIYYRVQAGPFADKASAAAVCDQLKTAGQQCLVKP
jgi:hypothetical protein